MLNNARRLAYQYFTGRGENDDMKRIILVVLPFLLFNNLAQAEEVFAGFGSDGKRYVTWSPLYHAIISGKFGDSGPGKISKHAASCLNDKYWRQAEMVKFDNEGSFHTFEFKFKWPLASRVVYVDIDDGKMSCRE